MKVAVLKNPYTYAYVVSDVPEEHRSRLLADLYWPVERSFLKQWGHDPDMEIIAGNFKTHGVESLEQFLKIRPAPWEQALSAFTEKLADTGIRWYIHGSAAMAIWGIDVVPRDLNIVFPDVSEFDRVRQLVLAETLYPLERCDGWVAAGLGGLFLHANVGLAFMNASDIPFDMSQLREVAWKGRKIAISPLEWLERDNRQYGRPERAELIERFANRYPRQNRRE